MTDRLDQAVEAGVMAWQHDCQDGNRERARAKAIIASILEREAAQDCFLHDLSNSADPVDAAFLDGFNTAIKTIRQRAGLEE